MIRRSMKLSPEKMISLISIIRQEVGCIDLGLVRSRCRPAGSFASRVMCHLD